MDTLNEEEQGLVACALFNPGFACRPEYLPACHRLYERGWLERATDAEYVRWALSEQGAKALELGGLIVAAKASVN